MRFVPGRAALQRTAYVAGALVVAYAVIGFFAVPYLIERYGPHLAAEALHGSVSVGEVEFNPFTLVLDARRVTIATPNGDSVLSVGNMHFNAQAASLLRWAWSFESVRFDEPDARIEIGRDGVLNLAALVPLPDGGPDATDDAEGPAPRVFVERFLLAGGRIVYADRSGPSPVATTFGSINLEATEVSTLRDGSGRYRLTATLLDGGNLHWEGSLTLGPGTNPPVVSDGRLALRDAALATAWELAPGVREASVLRGALTLESNYRFALRGGRMALVFEDGTLSISDLVLGLRDGNRQLASIKSIEANGVRLDVAARDVNAARLAVRSGRVAAAVDESGTLDWRYLVGSGADGSPSDPATPWGARIAVLHLEEVALDYSDHSRSPPLDLDVGSARADLRLWITTGRGGGAQIDALELALADVTISDAQADAAVVRAESLGVSGGRLDTTERTVFADAIQLRGGDTAIVRDGKAPEGIVRMLASPRPGAVKRGFEAIRREAAAAGRPWRYAVTQLTAKRFAVAFLERGRETELRYDTMVESATLAGLDSNASAPARLRASVAMAGGGTIDANGTVGQRFEAAEVTVNARDVALTPLQPLLARYARLRLESGAASASARLRYSGGEETQLSVEGRVAIADALARETATGDRLAAWKTLEAEGIAYALPPNRLTIKDVRLDAPAAKIAISEERDFNLARLVEDAGSRGLPGPESNARSRRAGGSTPPLEVLVERVTLQNGTVDFSDRSLALPYSTEVRAVEGTAEGLSSDASRRATLAIAGEIQEYGSARASGRVLAANPIAYTDIVVEFDNVAMPPLSPYSATFAGRKIESGRLWLDLHYAIEQGHMKGDNEARAADLRLGERVEAPDAVDLPLDLAVALLTGPDGEINVAVPVEGEVGDPDFDYGRVVRQALANLVTRIVSAPFRVLGSLVGGERAAELRAIAFEPGRATIAPEARETLDKVAKALQERPRLRLVVHGPYDPDRDAAALRAARVRDALSAERDRRRRAAGAPVALAYDEAATQRALERLFRSRLGREGLDAFARDYGREKGTRPETVDVLGRAGEPAYYAAMHRRLVELQPLPEGALERVAGMRASAIVDYLIESAGLDPARIEAGEIRPVEPAPDSGVLAELGVGIMPGAS